MKKQIITKKETKLSSVKFDGVEDISKSDIVKLSKKLLDACINSTDILNVKEMTPEKLKEAKIVL
jgi:hypothetical protein